MQPARQSPTFEPAQARSLKQTGPRSAVPRFGNRRLAEHRPRPATGWLVDVARDKCPAGQPTPTPQDPAPAFTQKVPGKETPNKLRSTLIIAHPSKPTRLRSPSSHPSPLPKFPPQLCPQSSPQLHPRVPSAPRRMGLHKTQKCKAAFCIPSAARAIIATHGVARDSHY